MNEQAEKSDQAQASLPDTPEAPCHYSHEEASAWQSGWEAGFAAARAA